MNIVKLQEQLKSVPDQALVGYVQNPGQVPSYLALSELQRRKTMRAQYQAQAAGGQPEQPSVAEQMTAPEMPEQGIASLPVENVGNEAAYAQGGIIAFAEGDEVSLEKKLRDAQERRKKESTTRYWAEQERAADERGVYGAVLGDVLSNIADLPSALQRKLTGGVLGGKPPKPEAHLAAEEYVDRQKERLARVQQETQHPETAMPAAEAAPITSPFMPALAVGDTPVAPVKPAPRAAVPVGSGGAGRASGVASVGSRTPVAPAGTDSLWTDIPDDSAGLDALLRQQPRTAQSAMQQMYDLIGPDASREEMKQRLAKLEAGATEDTRQAPWLALANAGFAMASGDSPFWAQNVGKGALVGMNEFTKSRDKLRDAEERRFDLQSRIAQAERAEQMAAAKFGLESEEADRAHNDTVKLKKEERKHATTLANAKGRFEGKKAALDAQLEERKLEETARYHQASIKAQQAQAAKLSDYETYLKLAREDDDNYKTDAKGNRIFDVAKVTEAYKSYGKSSTAGIDEDTIVREFTKYQALYPDADFATFKAQFTGTNTAGVLPQGITVRKNQ